MSEASLQSKQLTLQTRRFLQIGSHTRVCVAGFCRIDEWFAEWSRVCRTGEPAVGFVKPHDILQTSARVAESAKRRPSLQTYNIGGPSIGGRYYFAHKGVTNIPFTTPARERVVDIRKEVASPPAPRRAITSAGRRSDVMHTQPPPPPPLVPLPARACSAAHTPSRLETGTWRTAPRANQLPRAAD